MYTWGIFLAYIRRRLSSRLCFHVFWEAGRDRFFLVSEPGFDVNRTWFLPIIWTSYNYTAIYIYYPMILYPLWINCPPFENSFLWSSNLSDCVYSLRVILIPILLVYSIFLILSFGNCSLHAEDGSRDQSAQRKRGVPARQHRSLLFPCILIFLSFPALFEFRGRNFY